MFLNSNENILPSFIIMKQTYSTQTNNTDKDDSGIVLKPKTINIEASNIEKSTTSNSTTQQPQRLNFKQLVAKYGKLGVIVYLTVSILSVGICYTAVAFAGLGPILMEYFHLNSETFANMGTFAIAYAIHKAIVPVRIAIVAPITHIIAVYLDKKKNLAVKKKYNYYR